MQGSFFIAFNDSWKTYFWFKHNSWFIYTWLQDEFHLECDFIQEI